MEQVVEASDSGQISDVIQKGVRASIDRTSEVLDDLEDQKG